MDNRLKVGGLGTTSPTFQPFPSLPLGLSRGLAELFGHRALRGGLDQLCTPTVENMMGSVCRAADCSPCAWKNKHGFIRMFGSRINRSSLARASHGPRGIELPDSAPALRSWVLGRKAGAVCNLTEVHARLTERAVFRRPCIVGKSWPRRVIPRELGCVCSLLGPLPRPCLREERREVV